MDVKPNIVIIMTDQQTPFLSRRYGYHLDTTPFLDKLASEGADFRLAYTSSPICVAARVSLFTGRFPSATRVKSNYNQSDAYYTQDLVDVLKGQGYDCWLIGKNHSHIAESRFDKSYPLGHGGGCTPDRTPQEMQFDGFLRGLRHQTYVKPTPFAVEQQCPYRAVSKAQEWIDAAGEKPFFLWLSFAEPHNPYQAPDPYYSMFPSESLPPLNADKESIRDKHDAWRFTRTLWEKAVPDFDAQMDRTRSNYHGMLRLIDDQVKRFVEFLKQRGLADNTLIVFLSDHGDFVGEYGLIRKGPEMPERLMRIPLFFWGAGIRPHVFEDALVSIVDVMPTLCEWLGAAIPMGVQGRSLMPLMTGESVPAEEFSSVYAEQGYGGRVFCLDEPITPEQEGALNDGCTFDELNSWTQSGSRRMVRKGDWKLVFDSEGRGLLYHLAADPMELHNVFNKSGVSSIQKELTETLLVWMLRSEDILPLPSQRYRIKRGLHNYYTISKGTIC